MSNTVTTKVNAPSGSWNLDPYHAEVGFSVRHAGISKVKGKFNVVAATFDIPEDHSAISITANIDAASFDSGVADRDAHVRSADFLDVENFPELSFASTSVTGEPDDIKVSGDLTIHGVTRPVVFEGEIGGVGKDAMGVTRMGVEAKAVISRKDFGLTWNAALEAGGVLVSDKVTINLDLSFTHEA